MNGEVQGGAKGSGIGEMLAHQLTEGWLCHIVDLGLDYEGGEKSLVSFE